MILLVDLVTTAKGGSHGQALSAFTFGHTNSGGFNGVFYGIIFGVTSYIGFETAADFGEETANPRRNIPIAVIVATLFAIVFYLWTTYSITIGFGVNNGAKMGADPVALKTIADHVRGRLVTGTLVEIGGMLAAFIVCVACATAAARTLFAMGREGVLPAAFGRTHPRFQTPVNATLAVTVVAILMALLMGYPLSDDLFGAPFSNYYFWATTGTLLIIVVYIMLCLGGIVYFSEHQGQQELEPAAARGRPAHRRGRVRRRAVRLDPPDAARHPQVRPRTWRWSGSSSASACWLCAAQHPAGQGRPDRLHPGRGGRHRRRDPRPHLGRHQREDVPSPVSMPPMAHPRVRRGNRKDPGRGRSGWLRTMVR